jgi:hypothetical protein
MRKIYILVVLLLGSIIIFVSIARASLEINALEDSEGKLRGDTLEVEIEKSNGEKIKETYRLPEIKMLPTNIFYGFKEIRDYLWLQFSQSNIDKAKTALFLADKKLAESIALDKKGEGDKALESGEKAVEKLEYAWTMLGEERDNKSIDLRNSIHRAVVVYIQVIKKMGKEGIDKNKYEEIENKIKTFKEKEEESYLG